MRAEAPSSSVFPAIRKVMSSSVSMARFVAKRVEARNPRRRRIALFGPGAHGHIN
jgi:hypothetical protein